MRLTGVLIGPAILAFLIVTGLSYVVPEPRSESQTQASGLAWGGRIFTSRAEFARWLEERGRSYEAWDRLHPGSPWATQRPKTRSTEQRRRPPGRGRSRRTPKELELVVVATRGCARARRRAPRDRRRSPRPNEDDLDRLMEPRCFSARRSDTAGERRELRRRARPRLAGPGQVARRGVEAAMPRLESAGFAARRGVEAAAPRLESAGLAAHRSVEVALPRLESAGSAARRGVEAAAAETVAVGGFVRYAIATGRFRGAMFYVFAGCSRPPSGSRPRSCSRSVGGACVDLG